MSDYSSPWTVGWEWLTGTDPKTRYFVGGDPFTELLMQHSHIQNVRANAIERLELGEQNLTNIERPYSLKEFEGVLNYFGDYSTLLTGGMTGNIAVTFLGSYKLKYSVIDIDWEKGTAKINFEVENPSTIASATRPAYIGYTKFWDTYIAEPLNRIIETGPMSEKIQYFNWTEPISFTPSINSE